jgi:hypothetical protein
MRYEDEKQLNRIDELLSVMKEEVDKLLSEGGMGDVA